MPTDSARFFRATLLVIALGGVSLELLALGPLRTQFWGFHLHAFTPPLLAIGGWVVVLAGAYALLVPGSAPGRALSAISALLERTRIRTSVGVILFAAGCGPLFWILRSRQDLLGDAWTLVKGLPHGGMFHPRQPLTVYIQHLLYQGLGPILGGEHRPPMDVSRDTVALGSVAAGILFTLIAIGLGWLLASSSEEGEGSKVPARATAILVSLVLLSQGYAELFFGYLENYTFNALFIGVYLLAGLLFLRGRLPLVVPLLVILTNVALNLPSVVLLPSAVLLAVLGLTGGRPRAAAAPRDLVITAVAAILIYRGLAMIEPGYSPGQALRDIFTMARTDQGEGLGATMFSASHFRDFFNGQYLIGPLGSFLFLAAMTFCVVKRRTFGAAGAFLALAALAYLAASWAISDTKGSYARDWDVFAPAGVAYTTAALYPLVKSVPEPGARQRFLLFALLVSLHHLVPWVLINHSEARSLARFETLPLGAGRTEVVLGRWHLDHGDRAGAARWFEKALRVAPGNVNAHDLLGELYVQEGRPDLAADAFRRAVLLRPDKVDYRLSLVKALNATGQYEEALPHLAKILERDPGSYSVWLEYGRTLDALGREEESHAAYERGLKLALEGIEKEPRDYQLNLDLGFLTAKLGRKQEALAHFRLALDAWPGSEAALFNVALMLMQAGRVEEARPYLERFIKDHPEHPMRAQAERWLSEVGGGRETGR